MSITNVTTFPLSNGLDAWWFSSGYNPWWQTNIKHQMAEPQVPDLLRKLKRASKALSLTAAWKELKYFPCFGESCFLQRVPPPHIQNIQDLADHSPGQSAVADLAGRSPEASSSWGPPAPCGSVTWANSSHWTKFLVLWNSYNYK